MKRPVPVVDPRPEPGYPPVVLPAASRRRFLSALLGGAATAVVGGPEARGQGSPLTRVDLVLRHRHAFDGCELVAERLLVQTRDRRLVELLRAATEHAGLESAVLAVLRTASCAEVTDRKRLVALEGRLARGLRAHYRTRTRRATDLPIVTLVLARRRPVRYDGFLTAPAVPVPRP
jgi:hypothetical protein